MLRGHRVGLAVSVALMMVLGLHSVVYFTATARIEAAIPAFVSNAAKEGWRVETGVPERAGWPWAPTVRLAHVVVTSIFDPATLLWSAEQVDLITPFHDLAALHVRPAGAQVIQVLPDPPIELRTADARLRVPFSADTPATLTIQSLIATISTTVLQIDQFRGEARMPQGSTALLGMAASGVRLVPPLPFPFAGPMVASGQIVARKITCPPQINPVADATGPVELSAFEITWGPLNMTATGTGGLDKDCQPAGRATLRVKGAVEIVDALAHGGVIAPGQASAARAVLGLLAIGARGDPITLPVAVAGRTFSVARIPLLRLPATSWPRP